MMIIGCDFHPSWQQVAWLDTETGETGERKLVHAGGEAKVFYQQLAEPVLVGMEATGNSQWFIEMVEDLGHTIWIGDGAQIRASYVRKQKTDKRDAAHILKLVVENRFPRLWTPNREQRDLRQLLLHRHKLVKPKDWGKTGDRRDVRQFPFVEKLGSVPSVPIFPRTNMISSRHVRSGASPSSCCTRRVHATTSRTLRWG